MDTEAEDGRGISGGTGEGSVSCSNYGAAERMGALWEGLQGLDVVGGQSWTVASVGTLWEPGRGLVGVRGTPGRAGGPVVRGVAGMRGPSIRNESPHGQGLQSQP